MSETCRRSAELVAACIPLLFGHGLAQRRGQPRTRTFVERREPDIGREYDEGKGEPDTSGEHVHRDERADDRHDDGHSSVEQQPVTMDAHRPGDQRRHAKQGGKVEDVRAHDDADAGVLVSCDNRRDRRGDFRRVSAERGHHPEQRLRETEPLADAIELLGEHDTRRDGHDERADE